jgi:hypothetical protein
MMDLRFEQVLEYLESGEKDPEFEQFLQVHPDGPQMLKEAKLLYELLHRQAGEDTGDDDIAGSLSLSVADSVQESRAMEPAQADFDADDEFIDDNFQEISYKDVMAAGSLAQRAAGRILSLGELTISIRNATVRLSFVPALSEYSRRLDPKKFPPKGKGKFRDMSGPEPRHRPREEDAEFLAFMTGRTQTGEVMIRGNGIHITAPGEMAETGSVRLQVMDSLLHIPMRGLELIFMPEKGPFTTFSTNSKGIAELPVTRQSGVLRIESKSPQLIHIRLEF